jgi:ribosomal-protein-alanine N-acetyltransferase
MSAVVKPIELNLRPMHVEDVARVMAIESRVYPFPWTDGIFRDCIHVGYCCWVAEHDGEIIGYFVMSVGAGEAHVLNLCVQPEFQNRGIGRGLLDHIVQLSNEHLAKSIFLEVRPSNKGALRLYHNAGFQEVGTRRDYYPAPNGRENALILERKLLVE